MASERYNPVTELHALSERRRALQEVVKVTLAISRLQHGLQAVLIMGEGGSELPRAAVQSFKQLSKQTQNLPTPQLLTDLNKLDTRIAVSLERIMMMADSDWLAAEREQGGDHDSDDIDNLYKWVEMFRRMVHTAVALRTLLQDRGEAIAPLDLPVATEQIDRHLEMLQETERYKRVMMSQAIEEMVDDLDKVIANPELTPEFRQAIIATQQELGRNLDHLNRGEDVEQMPMAMEWIEMGEGAKDPFTTLAERHGDGELAPGMRQPLKESVNRERRRVIGFWQRVARWVMSPWSVSWRNVNRQADREERGE